jgi:hypothetical protein
LLAGDGSGILLLGTFTGRDGLFMGRWRDLLVLLPIFLYFSHIVAEATEGITRLFEDQSVEEKEGYIEQFDRMESILKRLGMLKFDIFAYTG